MNTSNDHVLKVLKLICPWVFSLDKTNRLVSKDEYSLMVVQLQSEMPIRDASQANQQLITYLYDNQLANVKVNAFPTIVELKRPSARVNIHSVKGVNVIGELDRAFYNSLKNCRSLSRNDLSGLILYSAMRYGLLLIRARVDEFLDLLNIPPKYLNGHFWYELPIEETGAYQIWNPDHNTLILLNIWYEKKFHIRFRRPLKKSWFGILKATFINLGVIWKYLGVNSPGAFIKAISTKVSKNIPAFINDCATGLIDNRTLIPSCYYRLISRRAPKFKAVEDDKTASSFKPSIRKHQKHSVFGQSDQKVYARIKACFKNEPPDKPSVISKNLLEIVSLEQSHITPTLYYVGVWISQRLVSENHLGNRSTPSTMLKKLSAIVPELLAHFGSTSPIEMGEDELTDIYEKIIQTASKKEIITTYLQDYHLYIVFYHSADAIDSGAPWGYVTNKFKSVDAKIITYKEFNAAVNEYRRLIVRYENSLSDRRSMRVCLVLLILGFYTGMRRREVIASRICDITRYGRQEFLVRDNPLRSLKSSNANRRLPIEEMIPPEHMFEINRLIKFRLKQGAGEDDFLFNIDELVDIYSNEEKLFFHIQYILQAVTGDNRTRFHHLRHSCATWALWRWHSLYLKTPSEWIDILPNFYQAQLIKEYERLFEGADEKHISDKLLYVLANMIGHSSPGISLEHYAHSVHWISNIYREALLPKLDSRTLAYLAGLSVRQIEKLSDDHVYTTKTISRHCNKQFFKVAIRPDLTGWKDPNKKRIGEYKREVSRERLLEFDILQALIEKPTTGLTDPLLAERHCVDKQRLSLASDRASAIFSMAFNSQGHNSLRHGGPKWKKHESEFPLQFPKKTRHRELAESMIIKYHLLTKSKQEKVDRCIDYFIDNGRINNSGLRFNKKIDLTNYLRLFDLLGLVKEVSKGKFVSAYRVSLVSCNDTNSLDRKAQWSHWSKCCDYKSYQRRDLVKQSALQKNGYIEIDYLSDAPRTVKKSKKRPPDWGYRFGLYLLAITRQEKTR